MKNKDLKELPMTGIEGPEGLSKDQIHAYREEFSRGIKLFQEALENYNTSTEPHQKKEFKKVMNESLNAMNEMVNVALRKDEQNKIEKLQRDYDVFSSNESSQSYNALQKDISSLGKRLEHG
jgi:hypothetical protein